MTDNPNSELENLEAALRVFLAEHRHSIWEGDDVSDEFIQLLSRWGVQIPTPHGMTALRDLVKAERA